MNKIFLLIALIMTFVACKNKVSQNATIHEPADDINVSAKFTLISPDESGVIFSNSFNEDYNYNIFVYEYMYNGGGVAAGDVNGDSLPDLYFSATFGGNRLYLNQGNFKFVDVTLAAGVEAPQGFKTGVTMADINGDGKMDIYSCRTSKEDDGMKNDFVFINTGNKNENGMQIPVFQEQGKLLGLEDNANTNHAVFFDFDRDGDMDLFQLNHRLGFTDATQLRLQQGYDSTITRITAPQTPFESNRLYRNDNGKFTDITLKAGVQSSAFGLSATAADINQDGWMDIYVANDYIEPDAILINNRNGTFTDKYFEYLKHSSQNSMGSDVADINNDGLVDIMVLDMKAEDPIRYKELLHVMHYDRYSLLEQYGYGRQVGRNVMQLNNGNNTFSEIGQFAGVAATDWSWGALMTDFDNDGLKDVFIANGYRKDVTNNDYMNFTRDSIQQTGGVTPRRFPDINTVLDLIPERKIANYLFLNTGNLQFINATKKAGLDKPTFSNGTAYADLDRDGDLDLIVNNVEDPAFIYRNDVEGKHWLQIDVVEPKGNTEGIGTTVQLYAGGVQQHQTLMTNKGFFSSSEPILHFGLDSAEMIDSIILQWPDGPKEIIKGVKADQRIVWKRGSGTSYKIIAPVVKESLFVDQGSLPGFSHQENKFVDFKRERLIPYQVSYEGPCISTGDVNGDQLEDVFVGNGSGYEATLFLQNPQNGFAKSNLTSFKNDALHEDCGSVLEDLDQDGDLDLVVISGGSSFNHNDPAYMTRHYINDGKGGFEKSLNFPIIRTNAGAILAFDYDGDNDKDLFIAGRVTAGAFPAAPKSHVLQNNNGKFVEVTKDVFPLFENIGMITDLEAKDLDGDGMDELIVVGEWIPISVFAFKGSTFENKTESFGLSDLSGWWKSVEVEDLDGDGDMDIVAGNMGLNHRMKTSELYPVTLISNDFDGNGSQDPILSYFHDGKLYPYAGKDAVIGQIPILKKKFIRYSPYARATVEDIFDKDKLADATRLTVNTFMTMVLINDQNKFSPKEIPIQAQLSPVYDIIVKDFDGNGKSDILLAGNFLYSETETAEMDAGNGTLLLQNADGTYRFEPNRDHGFWAQGEVRELKQIMLAKGQEAILTGNNQGPVEIHMIKNVRQHVQ